MKYFKGTRRKIRKSDILDGKEGTPKEKKSHRRSDVGKTETKNRKRRSATEEYDTKRKRSKRGTTEILGSASSTATEDAGQERASLSVTETDDAMQGTAGQNITPRSFEEHDTKRKRNKRRTTKILGSASFFAVEDAGQRTASRSITDTNDAAQSTAKKYRGSRSTKRSSPLYSVSPPHSFPDRGIHENSEEDNLEPDSMESNFNNIGHQQSDREFLLQQIRLLKTPFYLEDCSLLYNAKEKRRNHIPLPDLQNTVRKVNNRTEDQLARHLNRCEQRKLLDNLQVPKITKQTKKTIGITSDTDGQLQSRYKEAQRRVTQIEEMFHKVKEQYSKHKPIGALISQVHERVTGLDSKQLLKEVRRRNTSGCKSHPLHHSIVPANHDQLVMTLFTD